MSIVKKEKQSIFDLPVWLKSEKLKSTPSKAKSRATKAPVPPCMASRQAREATRNANLKTVAGANFEMMCDHYHELKMPEDW